MSCANTEFSDFFTTLNVDQLRASQVPLTPCLVLAGPGTGKTRTLLARLLYLIDHYQISPHQILAVTYTNKAKEELRQRLQTRLKNDHQKVFISTFHTFCLHILRQHYQQLQLPRHFGIADEDRQLYILEQVAKKVGNSLSPRQQRDFLARLSQSRLDHQAPPLTSFLQQLRQGYQDHLKEKELLDFDDLLFKVKQLFFEHPPILNQYRQQFAAILIDEFQDTDRVQYEIIKQLGEPHQNIFAVADDDQSIFSWRGAYPQNIQQFQQDFPHATVIELTINYRSHPAIIQQAQAVLASPSLTKKLTPCPELFPSTTPNAVELVTSLDYKEQAKFIIQTITTQMQSFPKLSYQDFAVLYARHSLGNQLQQLLMEDEIPCQLVRGKSLLDNPVIKRTLALLQILHNSKDRYHLQKFVEQEVGPEITTRIKKFQQEDHAADFLSTLTQFSRRRETPEIEREKVAQTIALVKNFLYLPKNQPRLRLSQLFDQIMDSFHTAQTVGLTNQLEQLSDPMEFAELVAAADHLYHAQQTFRPILVLAQSADWEFVAQRILQRLLAVETTALAAVLTADGDVTNVPTQAPLVLMLDGRAPSRLQNLKLSPHPPIYLGLEYTPSVRQQLELLQALVVNPEQITPLERGAEPSVIALLFKLCQAVMARETTNLLVNYVALDLETTGLDIANCDLVEIAAVRVRAGQPVAEFHQLIKPRQPISPGATQVHGLTEKDLQQAPEFNQIAPDFMDFIGNDTLVAHNGIAFDFPCLRRKLKEVGRVLTNDLYDTLPLAAQLYPEKSWKLDALAHYFNIPRPTQHRALEDTQALVQLFEQLKSQYHLRLRKTSGQSALDWVATGMILEQQKQASLEAIFIQEGLRRLHNSYIWDLLAQKNIEVSVLKHYFNEFTARTFHSAPHSAINQEVHPEYAADLAQILEIVQKFDHPQDDSVTWNLTQAIQEFLDFVTLYQQADAMQQRNAVSLMTIYAAKGLEFAQVFVIGLEDRTLPSYQVIDTLNKVNNSGNPSIAEHSEQPHNSPSEAMAEQRRLLYVAITRAKQRLYLMHVQQRQDRYGKARPQQRSRFLTTLPNEQG
jgi:DNA helicase II / ATP-dependent DNA helicase PcrA